MKSIKTLALVTGLLAISGVSQAQFSSTWTAVSDYDFRGVTQSGKDPALQASADYAFSNGLSIGAWASNIDFGNDEDMELDLYLNYVGKINDTFSWTTGGTLYMYPTGDAQDDYPEIYVGFNAGAFSFKQWYSWDFGALADATDAEYTEVNYTAPINDAFSLAFHAGYAWGDYWDGIEQFDYAVQANYVAGHFTIFGKFTGTDASGDGKVTDDVFNNEPRFLVGVMTTFPWGE
ncbi:MAG TPA: TorF family putative porin [Steroidobacteraceae bacterium]|nr:TorF family putative porin [Steroidobacteraceae bacterium]